MATTAGCDTLVGGVYVVHVPGLQGRTGLDGYTPKIDVDTIPITPGGTPSVIRSGPDENPLFTFRLPKIDTDYVKEAKDASDRSVAAADDALRLANIAAGSADSAQQSAEAAEEQKAASEAASQNSAIYAEGEDEEAQEKGLEHSSKGWAKVSEGYAKQVTELSAEAETLEPGTPASADYSKDTGVLSLGIPKGFDGDSVVDAEIVSDDLILYLDNQYKGNVDDELSLTSVNPVENKVITAALNEKAATSEVEKKADKTEVEKKADKTEVEKKVDNDDVITNAEIDAMFNEVGG